MEWPRIRQLSYMKWYDLKWCNVIYNIKSYIAEKAFHFRGGSRWLHGSFPLAKITTACKYLKFFRMQHRDPLILYFKCMMTTSNGNIFRVIDHLCMEFTGHQWIPRTKASEAELWCFLWSAPKYLLQHYLNQCCNIVNWTLWNKVQWHFIRNSYIFIQENPFQNVV